MTQNPYEQQYPPQPGYGQQYPFQGPPQGYQQAPQGYQQAPPAGPPQGWAPQGQQGPPQGGEPEAFKSAAPATAGGENPRISQMSGRLLLFRPVNYNPAAKGFGDNPPGPQIETEAIVLDGPPIEGVLNAKTMQLTPFSTGPRPTPLYVPSMFLNQRGLIQQLEGAVPSRSFCLNRVNIKDIGQGKTWYELLEMTPADEQLAQSIIGPKITAGWERIKAESLARYAAPTQPDGFSGGQGQQAPVYGTPPDPWGQQNQQQGPPAGYGQQAPPAYGTPPGQQGPPQGWGQPTGQQGPPPGWGQQ